MVRHSKPRVPVRRALPCPAAMSGRGLIVLAISAVATAALAQWKSDLEACSNESLSPQERIEVCTKASEAKDLSAPDRAMAYNNRGVALKAKGDLDQAIANYDR